MCLLDVQVLLHSYPTRRAYERVGRALAANPPTGADPDGEELDRASLRWHLYAALLDPAVRGQPAMAQLAGYLDEGDPLKAWSLAGELAADRKSTRLNSITNAHLVCRLLLATNKNKTDTG